MRGYRREDGLFDIEGCIKDVKPTSYQPSGGRYVEPGTHLHEMWVRLTIDDNLVVQEVHGSTDFAPFPECPGAAPGLAVLKGANMGKGWRKALRFALTENPAAPKGEGLAPRSRRALLGDQQMTLL